MTRRRLSDDERVLWGGVIRSIAPLRSKRPTETADDIAPAPARPEAPAKIKSRARPVPAPASQRAAVQPPPPPLAPLGRRFKQEVSRGRRAIDARLDLHGMTQAQAHSALIGFLRSAQSRGHRLVLVITGKGAPGDDGVRERGVLRRQVPLWLRLPEFRQQVIGFEAAGIGHGGDGALYVSLRRARAAPE